MSEEKTAAGMEESGLAEAPSGGRASGGMAEGGGLPGVGFLFGRAWEIYKKGFFNFCLIFLSFMAPIALIAGLGVSVARMVPREPTLLKVAAFAWIAAGVVVALAILVIAQIALVYAVSFAGLRLREIYARAARRFFSFLWLYILVGAFVMGGLALFVVPGVVFMVWFAFAFYVLAVEEERGLAALIKSRRYLSGVWGGVFWRLFVVWILSFALGMIPSVGSLFSMAFTPFMMAYGFVLYTEVKALKGPIPASTEAERRSWRLIGLAMAFAAAVFLAAVLLSVGEKYAKTGGFFGQAGPPVKRQAQ